MKIVDKKAEQMFKELGYSVEPNPNYGRIHPTYILKSYIIGGLVHSERDRIRFYIDETYDVTTNVDKKLHEAISKQIKELGW